MCAIRKLIAAVALPAAAVSAQVVDGARPESGLVEGSYLVHFAARSFDLEPFRAAMLARRPVAEIESIASAMEQAVRRDQAEFVGRVEALGGRVTAQWWIINGAAVSGGPALAAALPALPGVARVEPDRWHRADNAVSRDFQHHRADQANLLQTSGGQPVVGTGIGVAILDTGIDGDMNSFGRPHRGFFIGGDPTNTSGPGIGGSRLLIQHGTSGFGVEDFHGHGTHVAGSVLNAWTSNSGMAPNANLIGIKMSNNSGSAQGSWLVTAWNWVAGNAAAHNIRVANNSFSGSPSLSDGIQMALDSCALNADVLITCSAGNSASDTTNSQNVWNGLAVGALNKITLTRASFSAQGPLDNFGRIYPDISAVGVGVASLRIDDEASFAVSSGTSMSSPMVSGAAALLRQVDPAITALETKALLLNNTRDIGSTRNDVGLGIIDCERSVKQALAKDYGRFTLTSGNPTKSIVFTPDPALSPARVTIAFMHAPGPSIPDVDLVIFDSANAQVAASTDTLISYERAQFTFQTGQQYRAEVRWIGGVLGTLDVAISGTGSGIQRPTLTAVNPSSTTSYLPRQITLTGTNLDAVDRINLGSTAITTFIIDSPTQIRFTPPSPFEIANHQLTVHNAGGDSNASSLAIQGVHPGVLTSPAFAFRGTPFVQNCWSDRSWQIALFLSIHNQPSNLPGIVNFGIGNNFSTLWYLINVACDTRGHTTKTWVFPTTAPATTVYFQGIPFDSSNLTLPLETSTINQISIF
jgi:subtilisin family serine protease